MKPIGFRQQEFIKLKQVQQRASKFYFLYFCIVFQNKNRMSLQIIVEDIKLFGKLVSSKNASQQQEINELRKFRMALGDKTYISKDYGFFISSNELVFDESFSFYYDNHSIVLYVEVYREHQLLDNSDLEEVFFAEFDLSDISSAVGDRLQTTFFNIKDQAIGRLTMLIEVFKQGSRFAQKVTPKILFQTVREQKLRQIKASAASKNIKNLMVNNALTNTLMTINYLEVKMDKQDVQIFNRDCFILIRYGFTIKAFSKVTKVLSKQSVTWIQYIQFMKNDDVKFQFFFLYYDDLGNLLCKAKGEIKYIVFDQTINNHTIVMFDRKSNIYGDLMVKFIQKEVEVVNIQNKIDKKLKEEQFRILQAIDDFNKFKFQSKNNNRILSQKLRQLELRQLQQQQQKMKPLDDQEKKKRQEHTRFIEFLQKEVIKIQRQLKKRQLEERKDQRKNIYHSNVQPNEKSKQKKFASSMTSSQFKQIQHTFDEIDEAHIVPKNVKENS